MKVSVLMSVYNEKAEYLNIAIQSILDQTFHDFEFIIVDDGSTDGCQELIKQYKDDRIVVVSNPQNYGLTKSLNIGLRMARGKYIARMDSDDCSYPERLALQYDYMERHPEIDILGSWVKKGRKTIKSCGSVTSKWRYARMLFGNVGIYHPTAFMRIDFLRDNGLYYDENMKKAQDFELWVKGLEKGRMYVFPQVLLDYRVHDMQISKRNIDEQNFYNVLVRKKLVDKLKVEMNEDEEKQFESIDQLKMSFSKVDDFFNKIILANQKEKIFDEKILKYELNTKRIRYVLGMRIKEKIVAIRHVGITKLMPPGYIVYMLYTMWRKQDVFHHHQEKLK